MKKIMFLMLCIAFSFQVNAMDTDAKKSMDVNSRLDHAEKCMECLFVLQAQLLPDASLENKLDLLEHKLESLDYIDKNMDVERKKLSPVSLKKMREDFEFQISVLKSNNGDINRK